MHKIIEIFAGRAALRWTILELRWPQLAAHLVRDPEVIDRAPSETEAETEQEPAASDDILALLADREVRRIIEEGLSAPLIRRVVGETDAEIAGEPTAA